MKDTQPWRSFLNSDSIRSANLSNVYTISFSGVVGRMNFISFNYKMTVLAKVSSISAIEIFFSLFWDSASTFLHCS